MLAEEEEEKEKERREMERRNQGRYWFVSSLYQKVSRPFWSDDTRDMCYRTGLLFWPITKHTDNPMNQSKLQVNLRGWHEARVNVHVQASHAWFSFCFLNEKVARCNARLILILFDTQKKSALSMTPMSCSKLRQLSHLTVTTTTVTKNCQRDWFDLGFKIAKLSSYRNCWFALSPHQKWKKRNHSINYNLGQNSLGHMCNCINFLCF